MAARGRIDQTTRYRSVEKWLQRSAKRPMLTVKYEEGPSPRVASDDSSSDSVRWRFGRFARRDQGPPETDRG
jgi:hypothetical protein